MARITEEEFEGKEVSRIYIAESVREAETVEDVLDENTVEYLIDIEQYEKPSLLTSPTNKGLVFYVLSGQADYCKTLLRAKGMLAGIIDD